MQTVGRFPYPRSFAKSAGLIGWILLGLLSAGRAETLTIATYNVENYGPANRMTEAGYRQEYPKPETEKKALRAVIRRMQADVLVLQEMGGEPYLEELQRDLRSEGIDYVQAILMKGSDSDRHVAVLSKRVLKSVVPHPDLEFPYFASKEHVKRGMLEVTITTSAGELTIFGVHLKSRFTDRPDDPMSTTRRIGEASAVRDCVLQRVPTPATTQFLIMGDCNDTKDSKAVQRLIKRGKTEIVALLPAMDSRGESWTHCYRKEESYSRVDHIFVSPGLRSAVKGGAARIEDGSGVKEASDHRPVLVVLEWPASQPPALIASGEKPAAKPR